MGTYADVISITNSGTADVESAQSTVQCQAGAEIYEISVQSLTVGNTYAVKIDAPGIASPQRYVIPSNGAAANTNGAKICAGWTTIKCNIPIPGTNMLISTYADVASATCKVNLRWRAGD
jgi:hypothetical protein